MPAKKAHLPFVGDGGDLGIESEIKVGPEFLRYHSPTIRGFDDVAYTARGAMFSAGMPKVAAEQRDVSGLGQDRCEVIATPGTFVSAWGSARAMTASNNVRWTEISRDIDEVQQRRDDGDRRLVSWIKAQIFGHLHWQVINVHDAHVVPWMCAPTFLRDDVAIAAEHRIGDVADCW